MKVVKLNLQVCSPVVVNLNTVCYMCYETHLLKLMLKFCVIIHK